jgi:hypothetical protein
LGFGVRSRHSEQAKTTGKRRSAAEEREEAKRQRLGGGGTGTRIRTRSVRSSINRSITTTTTDTVGNSVEARNENEEMVLLHNGNKTRSKSAPLRK